MQRPRMKMKTKTYKESHVVGRKFIYVVVVYTSVSVDANALCVWPNSFYNRCVLSGIGMVSNETSGKKEQLNRTQGKTTVLCLERV